MKTVHQFTAIIERENGHYVSLCPELDIASQGETVEQARLNLKEALELFFETASKQEIRDRLHDEVFITRLEVAVGYTLQKARHPRRCGSDVLVPTIDC